MLRRRIVSTCNTRSVGDLDFGMSANRGMKPYRQRSADRQTSGVHFPRTHKVVY
jgi:hypothetical protein